MNIQYGALVCAAGCVASRAVKSLDVSEAKRVETVKEEEEREGGGGRRGK